MSTMKEITESKVTIYLKPKESVFESFIKDLLGCLMLTFCIYISIGSTWWTFVTGLMFLFFLSARTKAIINNTTTTFVDKKAAIDYLNGLDLLK